jgi:hypothetical protein
MSAEIDGSSSPWAPVHLDARFVGPTDDVATPGECLELSRDQLFIGTPDPAPEGQVVRFDVGSDSDLGTIRGAARVLWTSEGEGSEAPRGMAMRVLRLDPGCVQILEMYLAAAPLADTGTLPLIRRSDLPAGDGPVTPPPPAFTPPTTALTPQRAHRSLGPASAPRTSVGVYSMRPDAEEQSAARQRNPDQAATRRLLERLSAVTADDAAEPSGARIPSELPAPELPEIPRAPNVPVELRAVPGVSDPLPTELTAAPGPDASAPPPPPPSSSGAPWSATDPAAAAALRGALERGISLPATVSTDAADDAQSALPARVLTPAGDVPAARSALQPWLGPLTLVPLSGLLLVGAYLVDRWSDPSAEPGAPVVVPATLPPVAPPVHPASPTEPAMVIAPSSVPPVPPAPVAAPVAAPAAPVAARAAPIAPVAARAAPASPAAPAKKSPRTEPLAESAAPAPADALLDEARACLTRGDNPCVIATLEGKARSALEFQLLIETYRSTGQQDAGRAAAELFLKRHPAAREARRYARLYGLALPE